MPILVLFISLFSFHTGQNVSLVQWTGPVELSAESAHSAQRADRRRRFFLGHSFLLGRQCKRGDLKPHGATPWLCYTVV